MGGSEGGVSGQYHGSDSNTHIAANAGERTGEEKRRDIRV